MRIKDTLYAKYIKEREGFEVLENEFCFLTYVINQKECFIGHFYTDESCRGQGKARELVESLSEVAAYNECELISASIDLRDKGASKTMQAALRVGFEIAKAECGVIVIVKHLKGVK